MYRSIKYIATIIILSGLIVSCVKEVPEKKITTICNPVDISYRFQLEEPSRREAADPTVVVFKDIYYLFASKSGGYWTSSDLKEWDFIQTDQIPTEEYAPTAIVLNDTLYFLASSQTKSTIYKSGKPETGQWSIARDSLPFAVWDPAFFLDDDHKLYLYWGCSDRNPIYGIELDCNQNFEPVGEPVALFNSNTELHGWEVPGDYNTRYANSPWIEGAWMNKIKGRYYLQYAGPGTEFKSYSDGVYISDSPLGPYELTEHNPFAYKPEGFANGAGHGSTFLDKYGNYWHIGTVTISVKHMFERRLALYPAFVDDDSLLYAVTRFGDYPFEIPDRKIDNCSEIFSGWMLLSYGKQVVVSSAIDSLPPENITDEDIRTYWSAKTGNSDEWVVIDLGDTYDVKAIQVNFAEHNTEIFGRKENLMYQYTIEASKDSIRWVMMVDKSENKTDNSHQFISLDRQPNKSSELVRFLRIKNRKIPGGTFAISGFRVFGLGSGEKPSPVGEFEIVRNTDNRRTVNLQWKKSDRATGYNIRYGIAQDKLYHNYLVYSDTVVTINTLNTEEGYSFTIESFNENGITTGNIIKQAQ